MAGDSLAIATVGLTKRFGDFTALDQLSLQVQSGHIYGFLGPNGSGKTTTIRLLLGLSELSDGIASVLGYDVSRNSHRIREKVGVLLENHGLYERLTILDNLNYFGGIYRLQPDDIRERGKELLQKMGIWEWRNEVVAKLSSGMKQRATFARLLLHRPQLVILDEPSTGLDATGAAAFRQYLINLSRSEGVTVFLATHNLPEAEVLCDGIAIINRGHLVASGTPDQVKDLVKEERLIIRGNNLDEHSILAVRNVPTVDMVVVEGDRIFIHLKSHGQISPIISALVHSGVEVEEVTRERASLEDVFLMLVQEPAN